MPLETMYACRQSYSGRVPKISSFRPHLPFMLCEKGAVEHVSLSFYNNYSMKKIPPVENV